MGFTKLAVSILQELEQNMTAYTARLSNLQEMLISAGSSGRKLSPSSSASTSGICDDTSNGLSQKIETLLNDLEHVVQELNEEKESSKSRSVARILALSSYS